jgi:hypothetical protein
VALADASSSTPVPANKINTASDVHAAERAMLEASSLSRFRQQPPTIDDILSDYRRERKDGGGGGGGGGGGSVGDGGENTRKSSSSSGGSSYARPVGYTFLPPVDARRRSSLSRREGESTTTSAAAPAPAAAVMTTTATSTTLDVSALLIDDVATPASITLPANAGDDASRFALLTAMAARLNKLERLCAQQQGAMRQKDEMLRNLNLKCAALEKAATAFDAAADDDDAGDDDGDGGAGGVGGSGGGSGSALSRTAALAAASRASAADAIYQLSREREELQCQTAVGSSTGQVYICVYIYVRLC